MVNLGVVMEKNSTFKPTRVRDIKSDFQHISYIILYQICSALHCDTYLIIINTTLIFSERGGARERETYTNIVVVKLKLERKREGEREREISGKILVIKTK